MRVRIDFGARADSIGRLAMSVGFLAIGGLEPVVGGLWAVLAPFMGIFLVFTVLPFSVVLAIARY